MVGFGYNKLVDVDGRINITSSSNTSR
jgi:hypothetical protein